MTDTTSGAAPAAGTALTASDISVQLDTVKTKLSALQAALHAKAGPILSDEGHVLQGSLQATWDELSSHFGSIQSNINTLGTKLHAFNNAVSGAVPSAPTKTS